jgi:hypothetical protein
MGKVDMNEMVILSRPILLLKYRRLVVIINYVCGNYGGGDNETGDGDK